MAITNTGTYEREDFIDCGDAYTPTSEYTNTVECGDCNNAASIGIEGGLASSFWFVF